MRFNYNFNHYWKHKGHNSLGLGMKNPSNNLFYKLIPKNASSMIRQVLHTMNWQYELFDEHLIANGLKTIVVLRDPMDRWISGITEYLTLYFPGKKDLSNDLLELICFQVTFDDHTEKQIYFVNDLNKNDCVFFKFNNNLGNNLATFFSSQNLPHNFSKDLIVYSSMNSAKHMTIKLQIISYLEKNPKYINSIQQHYSQDYDLLKTINYYGTN